jgi:hypothetical protein
LKSRGTLPKISVAGFSVSTGMTEKAAELLRQNFIIKIWPLQMVRASGQEMRRLPVLIARER